MRYDYHDFDIFVILIFKKQTFLTEILVSEMFFPSISRYYFLSVCAASQVAVPTYASIRYYYLHDFQTKLRMSVFFSKRLKEGIPGPTVYTI